MLKSNKNNGQYEPYSPNEDTVNVRSMMDKVVDRWPWFLICLIVSLLSAFLVNWLSQPLYNATTSVMVTQPKDMNNAVSELLYGQEFFGTTSKNLENEAYVIQSFENVENTLRDLDLNVTYYLEENVRKNELYKSGPLKVTVDEASYIFYQGLIRCKFVSDNKFRLEVVYSGLAEKIKGLIQPSELEALFENKTFNLGEMLDFNGFRFQVEVLGENVPKDNLLFKIQDYGSLTGEYLGNLKIAPHSLESSILEISVISTHKLKARDFVNKLVEKYYNDELSRKNNTAEKTITFIDDQILLMGDSLSSVENRLETFKKSNTDLTISSDGSEYLAQSQAFESTKSQLILNNRYLTEL